DTLMREVKCPGFPAAIALVVAVADAAQEADHHPDIDIRYDTVRFALSTHSAGGLTALDLRLAERISALVEATA
ncbi:MAG: 4a-hydroxytetrahydrobiopterin dehydratase, partial [Jatrophihabitantaceae bacterium]|nr:4a-hydroxytetrahydrobiopterin dehydratase [Jatrophihabitantaceae bacterium]